MLLHYDCPNLIIEFTVKTVNLQDCFLLTDETHNNHFSQRNLFVPVLASVLLLFSRRFSKEKYPTLTVASFFSSDYNLTLIGPLFLQSKQLKLLP